jgi:tetratricopeptide (TPR) repeat protein
MTIALDRLFDTLQRHLAASEKPGIVDIDGACDFAIDANAAGRTDLTINLLEPLSREATGSAKLWQLLGLAYRQNQQMALASAAFERAIALSPHDVRIALGKAQIDLETGKPAATQFGRIRQMFPGDPQIALAAADALQSEGRAEEAAALLNEMLDQNPEWVAGHDAFVRVKTTTGAGDSFASFTKALEAAPTNNMLRLAGIRALAQQEHWGRASAALRDARYAIGELPELDAIAAYIATETGDHATAQVMFERTKTLNDPGIALYRVRHCLRNHRVEEAAALGEALVQTPAANGAWPYLSLAWRLLGDDRAGWLDGEPPYFKVVDLDISETELADLAALLRQLHVARQHLPEQSVRGGTQTDKPLFHRLEPEIALIRQRVLEAVKAYIADLPPFDASHPLLGTPRGHLLFEGSWSVRLRAQGFHTMHTHPGGSISSALYVSLPGEKGMGPAPAGWLDLGSPPPELGLDLPGYAQIEPKPGRLVLFPSTMWHGTVPFNDGERLTIAFDVRTPTR